MVEWMQKHDPCICCLQETHFRAKDTHRLKVRGWKNIFCANGKQKKAEQQSSYQTKQILKKITRDKEEQLIIKRSITTVNIYAPNIGAPQYIRQSLTDIKGEIDSNTIIVGDFSTPLTPTDR